MSEYIVERIFDQTTGLDHFGRREEIVRCKDCNYSHLHDFSVIYNNHDHDQLWCLRFVGNGMMVVDDDGFCAWGELR